MIIQSNPSSVTTNMSEVAMANTLATVMTYILFLEIFLLGIWIMLTCLKSNKLVLKPLIPMLVAGIVGFIILLAKTPGIEACRGLVLWGLLLYASILDLKTRHVSNFVSLMILLLSLVRFQFTNLPSMLIGAMIVFIPQFALAIIRPSRACGGADLKISTAIAFMLGAGKGVFALIVGMLLAIIVMAIYNKVNAKDQKEAFPLVPFLSVGAMLAYII